MATKEKLTQELEALTKERDKLVEENTHLKHVLQETRENYTKAVKQLNEEKETLVLTIASHAIKLEGRA